MMTATGIQSQFQASMDLLRGRQDAVRRFDVSIDGFWTSFQIIVLALVPYLFVVTAEYRLNSTTLRLAELDVGGTDFFVSRLVGLPIEWITFPLVMIPLARWLKMQKTYVPYVVVRNWTNLPTLIAYALCALPYIGGVVGEEGFMLLSLIAFGIAIRLKWLALRLVLGTDVQVSIALLVIDLLLSVLVLFTLDSLFGMP